MLITGMHRSGTSAVALLVRELGGRPLPGDELPLSLANPGGFGEVRSAVALDDSLLARVGGSWYAPPPLTPRQLDAYWSTLPHGEIDSWRVQVGVSATDAGGWFVKDPRICFLTTAWDRIALRRLPMILCVRHPLEVAESLRLRDGVPPSAGVALWLAHTIAACVAAQVRETLVVDRTVALGAPEQTAASVASFMAAAMGLDVGDTAAAARVIDPGLNRAAEVPSDRVDPSLAGSAVDLYEALGPCHGRAPEVAANLLTMPMLADDLLHLLARAHREEMARQAAQARVTAAEKQAVAARGRASRAEQDLNATRASLRWRVASLPLRPLDAKRRRGQGGDSR